MDELKYEILENGIISIQYDRITEKCVIVAMDDNSKSVTLAIDKESLFNLSILMLKFHNKI